MSDIHGLYPLYLSMLERIGFSDGDRLYILGDAVDRGPGGVGILLHAMKHRNIVFLRGNHEQMMLDSVNPFRSKDMLDIWMNNGGRPTLQAFLKLGFLEKNRVLRYIRKAPDFLDITVGDEAYHLVHGCPGNDTKTRLWEKPNPFGIPKFRDKRVIVGHTPVMYFQPSSSTYLTRVGDHMKIHRCESFIGIDCGCGLPWNIPKKALACLRLEDGEEFYLPVEE